MLLLVGLGVGLRSREVQTLVGSFSDKFCSPVGILWVVPQIQFSDRVDGVRDGVLLVLPSVVSQRQAPTVFFFQQGSGCCSTLTRSSMSGTLLLYGGL